MAHNSHQTWLIGRIVAHGNGSEIAGVFRIARSTAAGTLIALGWFVVIGGAGAIMGTGETGGHLAFASFTCIMVLVGLAFFQFGRWLARNDEAAIVAMLEDALLVERVD